MSRFGSHFVCDQLSVHFVWVTLMCINWLVKVFQRDVKKTLDAKKHNSQSNGWLKRSAKILYPRMPSRHQDDITFLGSGIPN